MNQCDCVANQDARADQALDDFWFSMGVWYKAYYGGLSSGKHSPTGADRDLAKAYHDWLDASKPPGDPHKEWVDADRLKPNDVFQPVLVKTTSGKTGLANWIPGRNFDGEERSWHVQLFPEGWYYTIDGVSRWRYMPQDDDNG